MIRRRALMAGAAAILAAPSISARRQRAAEVHPAVRPDDPRSDRHHRLHRAQPRHDGVRHAVRHGQRVPDPAADAGAASPSRTTASAGSSPCATACCGTTARRVLARDCVASIRRWAVRDGIGSLLMARTDELAAIDDRTIQFRLKRPFSILPYALGKISTPICAMMPERLANTDPFKAVSEMVGSGPFRFKADEWVSGSLAVYTKFDRYVPRRRRPPAGPPAARSCISSASSGTSAPTTARPPVRCRPARWTGGNCRPRTCCRC